MSEVFHGPIVLYIQNSVDETWTTSPTDFSDELIKSNEHVLIYFRVSYLFSLSGGTMEHGVV